MNYEEMSDNELNMMVADLRGGYAGNVHGSESMVKVSDPESCGLFYMEVDYCNNPSDAWPIIYENEISLVVVDDDTWVARIGGIYSESSRPLRAAMIVFLRVMENVQ